LAVDTGSLTSCLSFEEQAKIKVILLSHGHYDHIREVPNFAFNNVERIHKVIANQHTLEILSSHLVDGLVYPDFTKKNSFLKVPVLELCPIELYQPQDIEGYQVTAMPVNHPIDANGFQITDREGTELFYTGDTGPGLSLLWQHIHPQAIIIDMTFPNRLADVAQESGHLCPQMLKEELTEFRKGKNYLPQIIMVHLSPQLEREIKEELSDISRDLNHPLHVASEGEIISI
jgi:Cft2 family RNA processing exonuclease